jgi:lysozyme
MHFSTFTLSLSALFAGTIASPVLPRACTGPSVNAATISLIKEFEGFVASPAPDPIGLPTVGYGHLCQTSGCSEVPYSFPLSESTASQLLASDVKVCSHTSILQNVAGSNKFKGTTTDHHPANKLQRCIECESVRRAGILDVQRWAG